MPRNNAWNGKWTGDTKFYAKVFSFGRSKSSKEKAERILKEEYFTYNFGDGWVARIDVFEVDNKEKIKIRKKSNGFCGYNWMIDSIIDNGDIRIKQTLNR
jgi:hypothetical protein